MQIDHKAGDKLYVDYAWEKLHLTDPETGEQVSVEVFVAILGCSQLTYIEASYSQKKDDLSYCWCYSFYSRENAALSSPTIRKIVSKRIVHLLDWH